MNRFWASNRRQKSDRAQREGVPRRRLELCWSSDDDDGKKNNFRFARAGSRLVDSLQNDQRRRAGRVMRQVSWTPSSFITKQRAMPEWLRDFILWIINSVVCFSYADVDRELQLSAREIFFQSVNLTWHSEKSRRELSHVSNYNYSLS